MSEVNTATQLIAVKVSFPPSEKGPYRADDRPGTPAGTVREAAMSHFTVSDSGQYRYVLTHEGQEVPDSETIGQVVGEAHSVEFRLVKELPQG